MQHSGIMSDAVIAAGLAHRRVFQPIQGALAGERGTTGPARLQLGSEDGQHRVVPQLVVVDQVLVAERDAEHPLTDQGGHLVLDPLR